MIGFQTLNLVARTFEEDELGQRIPKDTSREVYARVESVSQSEFFLAGQNNLRPSFKAILTFAEDYQGEKIAEYEGKRYAIYRTYITPSGQIELYLQRETGVR